MPLITAPVSDMQRRGAALVRQAHETKQPIYLTRHGVAEVALVDAEAFDEFLTYQRRQADFIRRRHEGIAIGHQQILNGEGIPWEELERELRANWGDEAFDVDAVEGE